jgi:hypothetical protein
MWATPRTITGGGESAERKRELGRDESGGGDLQSQAQNWPTPSARDHKGSLQIGIRSRTMGTLDEAAEQLWPQAMWGGSTSGSGNGKNEALITTQAGDATCRSSRPDQATSTPGDASSQSDPTSRRRLNRAFVEWLMGWPEGWTDFGRVETAWSHWSQRMRSCLYGLVCTSDDNEQGQRQPDRQPRSRQCIAEVKP